MDHHFARQVVTRVADSRVVRGLLDVREIMLGAPGSDGLVERVAVRAAPRVSGEPRIVGEVGGDR